MQPVTRSPMNIVSRPAEYDRLVSELVDQLTFGPVAITTALPGARGFGKTSLARSACADARVVEAFPDGIFWVNLGAYGEETGENGQYSGRKKHSVLELLARLNSLISTITGEPAGVTDLQAAEARLHDVLHPLQALLVLDEVPDEETLQRFMHTGPGAACLIITHDDSLLPFGARKIKVDGMRSHEAVALLTSGLPMDELYHAGHSTRKTKSDSLQEEYNQHPEPENGWDRLAGQAEEIDPILAELPSVGPGETVMADASMLAAVEKVSKVVHLVEQGIPAAAAKPFTAFAHRLKDWPLLLVLANGLLIRNFEQGPVTRGGLEAALEATNAALTAAGLEETWKLADEDSRYQALMSMVTASLETLGVENGIRCLDLVVFQPETDIPPSAVAMLWAHNSGMKAGSAARLIEDLVSLRLLEQNPETGMLRIPLALHGCLRARLQSKQLPVLHERLVEAYREQAGQGWTGAPDDGYLVRHLPLHLVSAGKREELQNLLFDFEWLNRSLNSANEIAERCPVALALLQDFDLALATSLDRQSIGLRLVSEALRMSVPLLVQEPGQLAAQLLGRLMGYDDPDIRAMMEHAALWSEGKTWLRPMTECFTPPGGMEVRKLEGHQDWVTGVAVFPDGQYAISGSLDGTMRIWDLSIGQSVRSVEAHPGGVTSVAVSPDGRFGLTGGADGKIALWDLQSGQKTLSIFAHPAAIGALTVSPDGKMVVSASDDHLIRLWDMESGDKLYEIDGHTEPVRALAFTPDGRTLVSGAWDDTVRLWDIESGQQLRALEGHTGWLRSVTVSPDGYFALSAGWDKTLRIWDLWTGEIHAEIDGFTAPVFAVAVTPDQALICVGTGDGELTLLDFKSGEEVRRLGGHQGGINAVAVTSSGRFVVTASDDSTLRIWDLFAVGGTAAHSQAVQVASSSRKAGHNAPVHTLANLPSSRFCISGSLDGTMKIWDLVLAEEVGVLVGHTDSVLAFCVDGSGKYAVSGSGDQTLRVWDLEARQEFHTLTGHHSPVTAVSITPDGRLAASGSSDGTICAWDVETGECLAVFHGENAIQACAVAPDGRTLAASESGGKMYFLEIKQ